MSSARSCGWRKSASLQPANLLPQIQASDLVAYVLNVKIFTSKERYEYASHQVCHFSLGKLFTGTKTTGLDTEVKELEDLKRRARVLRQQYAGTATSRPEVAKSLHAEVYKVGTELKLSLLCIASLLKLELKKIIKEYR